MASSKEYLNFILEQLSELEEITYKRMMGEYIIYYRGKIVGSIRGFLYRWDDGKGAYFLVQCYKLNKFSLNADTLYEDWYAVESEKQADKFNREYSSPQLERKYKAVYTGVQEYKSK